MSISLPKGHLFKFGKRSKDTISIQIETSSIKFALGKYSDDVLIVHQLLSLAIDSNIFDNGMPVDERALCNVIDSGVKQLNTNAKDVVIAIESSEILKREIQVPKVEESDLKDLVRFEVSQYLPIEVDDYVLQHQVISHESDGDNEKLNVLIVAMPKKMAEYYFNLLSKLRLNPVGMDIAGNNAVKLVKFAMNDILLGKTTAILDFAYANLEIIILEDSLNKLNRLINSGPYHMDKQVAEQLGIQFKSANKLVRSFIEVGIHDLIKANNAFVDLKKQENEDIDGFTVADFNKSANKKMLAVSTIVDHIKDMYDEIEKVFKYYTFRERGNRIDQIILYGDYAKIEGLMTIIEERLNIKAQYIESDKLNRVMIKSQTPNINSYIGAIGGLIR